MAAEVGASGFAGAAQIAQALDLGLAYTMIGGVVDLVPGQRIRCTTRFHELAWLQDSHFRSGTAIVPGALITEAFAQGARLLQLLSADAADSRSTSGHGLLAEVRIAFRKKVALDARPDVVVRVDGSFDRFSAYQCECVAASTTAASGRLLAYTEPDLA